jgi:hypothetical protein
LTRKTVASPFTLYSFPSACRLGSELHSPLARAPRHSLAEALEPRRLLSLSTINPNDAVPFQKLVIDQNPGTVPTVRLLVSITNSGHQDAVIGHDHALGGDGLFWYQYPASGNPADPWIKHTIDANANVYEAARAADISGHVDSHGNPVNDLVVNESGTIVWYENPLGDGLNPATATWTKHTIGTVPQGASHELFLVDLDGDGKLDVATNTAIFFQNSPTSWTLISTADYNRTELGLYPFDSGSGLGAVDMIGTGNAPDYSIGWYENPRDHGGNARTDLWVFHPIGPAYGKYEAGDGVSYAAVDVNGDGREDIISCDSEDGDVDDGKQDNGGLVGGLIWWEAPSDRANGVWTEHTIDASVSDVHNVVLADVNGDGTPEILAFEQDQAVLSRLMIVYNEGGTGQNWLEQTIDTGGGHNEGVGDANADGSLDIISSPHGFYTQYNPISLYLNQISIDGIVRPTIKTSPASQSINNGDSVTFSVSAAGTGPLTYQWQQNGADIPGATSSSYTLYSAPLSGNAALFRCIVGNAAGLIASAPATLSVSPVTTPVATLLPPSDITTGGAASQPQTLIVTYVGSAPIDAASLNGSDLQISGPAFTQPATYIGVDGNSGSNTRVATYSLPAPAGGWTTASNGAYSVSLQAGQVDDTGGLFATAELLGTFNIAIPNPTLGALAGSRATALASYNLTALGTSDWAHWGRGATYGNLDHKATGNSQISNVSVVGSGASFGGYSDSSRSTSWTDGTPAAAATNDHGYIWSNGALNSGYAFTVPADTTPRTLVVYAGGINTTSSLTAHLSDNSAADYTVSAGQAGLYTNVYTITYHASLPGQTLTITLLKTANLVGTNGSADLIAAYLAGPPAPDKTQPQAAMQPPAIVSSATSAATLTVLYTDNVAVKNATLLTGNLVVSGPTSQNAILVNASPSADSATITAAYVVAAPAGGWTTAANGTYGVALAPNSVSDTSGNFAPATNLGTLQIAIPTPGSGSVSGVQATAAAPYNLTTLGTSDWAHWGRGGQYTAFDHKTAGGSQISNVSTVGTGGSYGGYSDPSRSVSWTDGTPTSSDANEHGYIWNNGAANTGYSFTVPADTTTRTLVVYAGGINTTSSLTAHLSDSTAADYSVSTGQAGLYTNVYTITYHAASAGQTLTITLLKTGNLGGKTNGSADLIAAYLAAPAGPDTTAPQASLQPTATITAANASATLTVVYTDNSAVQAATLGNSNLQISGPVSQTASFVSASPSSDNATITATYGVAPPAGGWTTAANGSYAVALAGNSVSDTSGNFAATANLGNFQVAIGTATAALLTGKVTPAAASYNLTALGTSDWGHWGTGDVKLNFDHKATGGSQISNVTKLGAGSYGVYFDSSRNVTWTDGTPTPVDQGDSAYLWANNALGAGYSFTVPADTKTRTLYIYAGGNSTGATLTAHLSGGSTADYIATTSGTGLFSNLYTITYNASSAGQTLTISYTKSSNINGATGSVDLMAAALA